MKMASKQQNFKQCVSVCPRYITGMDTHDLCINYLRAEHAWAALEGPACEHCQNLPLKTLCSHLAVFSVSGQPHVSSGSGPVVASLQFGSRPPKFSGVLPTVVRLEQAQVMEQEVKALLVKEAIE